MSLDLARVVAVHPESGSVDLVTVAGGRRITGVKVMSGSLTRQSGFAGLHKPDAQGFDADDTGGREALAVVASFGQVPVVLGFLPPQVSAMMFADVDRMVYRHPSDVYFTIDADGNTELSHPSGAFLRIATSSGHEDLTGKDYDGKWKISRNTGKQVHMHFEIPGQAMVDLSPAGALSITCSANATIDVGGAASVTAGGAASVTSGGPATMKAPSIKLDSPMVECTGALKVALVTTTGGLSSLGTAGGGTAKIAGGAEITGGALTHMGVNVGSTHVHDMTNSGPGATTGPR